MSGKVTIAAPPGAERAALAAALRSAYFSVSEADSVDVNGASGADILVLDFATVPPPPSNDTPFVALSPRAERQAAAASLAGADDFIDWPDEDGGAVCTRLRALLRRRAMADEAALRHETGRQFGFGVHGAGKSGGVLILAGAPPQNITHRMMALARELDLTLIRARDPDEALALGARGDAVAALIWSGADDAAAAVSLANALSSRRPGRNCAALVALAADDAAAGAAGALDLAMADWVDAAAAPSAIAIRLRGLAARARVGDELRQVFEAGLRLAATDPLTGFYNRRYAETHLARLCAWSRARGSPLSLMMIDIDRFKSINDAFGHEGGDRALCDFAARLKGNLRGGDLIARMGGDEFIVVAPETGEDAAVHAAERLRRVVAETPFEPVAGAKADLTVSIGVASLAVEEGAAVDSNAGTDSEPDALRRAADAALYAAKAAGRNQVRAAPMVSPPPRRGGADGHTVSGAGAPPDRRVPDQSAWPASRPSTIG